MSASQPLEKKCKIDSSTSSSSSEYPHAHRRADDTSLSVPAAELKAELQDSDEGSSTQSSNPDSLISYGGCELSEVHTGSCVSMNLPPLKSSANHTIMFQVAGNILASIPRPYPDVFRDVWDSNHVKMPCSQQSMYPVTKPGEKEKTLESRWKLIRQAFSKSIRDSYELEEAIMSYNTRYIKRWNFRGLHAYFSSFCQPEEKSEFFDNILPQLIVLALELPHVVTHALPLLKKQQEYSLSMTQQQAACLLANAFLCTFPLRNSTSPTSEYSKYPSINFNSLYSQDTAEERMVSPARVGKLRCIHHYFRRVTSKMSTGVIDFSRRQAKFPAWEHSPAIFTKVHATSDGTIENDGLGMLQVDFANKYIGGGVIGSGCVQEEIRFLICPELILSRLFVEELDANEVVVITGTEMFSTYRGYASSFEWAGDYVDSTPRDSWGRKNTTIVAMDAVRFSSLRAQFRAGWMRREINKAYAGFKPADTCSGVPGHRCMAVATGKWGCGAFQGHIQLKTLLQLMAASQVSRDVVFFTFGDKSLVKDICSLHSFLVDRNCTVGQVWQTLLTYKPQEDKELFKYVITELGELISSNN